MIFLGHGLPSHLIESGPAVIALVLEAAPKLLGVVFVERIHRGHKGGCASPNLFFMSAAHKLGGSNEKYDSVASRH